MKFLLTAARALGVVGCLGAAASANATPVVYTFTSGQATLSATFGSLSIGSGTIPLTGTQVTFNTSPLGLTSFQFTAGPASLPLSGILTGTTIALTGVNVIPGGGYTSTVFGAGPTYNYSAGPVSVSGTAQFTGTLVAGPLPFAFTNPILTGQINTLGGSLSLNGITLGVIAIPAAGIFPGGNVTLKADILFTGIVPEPGTALLLGSGLLALGGVNRRRLRA